MTDLQKDEREEWCSFCGKTKSEVNRLVSSPGPTGTEPMVFICDECIVECIKILWEGRK